MIESIYLILLFFIAWFEIGRNKPYKIDFLTLFHIYYALLYPLPGLVLAIDYQNAVSPLGLRVASYSNNIQTSVAVVIGYFVILFGFYSKLAINFGKNIIINARKNDSIFIDYVIFLLVIGALSIYIYGLQYGGVLIAIAQNSMIRARAVEGGNLVFFSRLTMYSVFSSYLLCSFVFIKKHKKISIWGIALFLLSLLTAIVAVLLTGSRAAFVFYFLTYYYVYLIRCKRIPWLSSITLLCCACLFLFYGKSLFYSLSAITQGVDAALDLASNALEDNQEFTFYNFVHNFQHPIFSLDVALSNKHDLRWFSDFIYAVINLLPNRLTGTDEIRTILSYNSEYIIGRNDFAIPLGLLAFGIYSLWWPGLVIICFVYGWIGRCLQNILAKHMNEIFWMPFFYIIVAQMWISFMSSDPETFTQTDISYFTGSILLVLIACKVNLKHKLKSNGA